VADLEIAFKNFLTPEKEREKDVKLDILSSKKELAANRQDLPVVASQ
jgi:hypothetical protein